MSALYLFVILLLVTTVISSFGGALRVEENFYNEVFDLTDEDPSEAKPLKSETEEPEATTVASKTTPEEPDGNDVDAITQAPVEPEEPTVEEKDIVEEEMVEEMVEEVEAYEMEEQYATF
tara:strand:- start:4059 stop:4418 length:360 start_codon:yes stop_codon:yes gene_type:complete